MRSAAWITFRAVVALMLMAGFYLLGIAVAASLLLVPYAEFAYGGQFLRVSSRLSLGIAAVCIGAAGSILWSLVPRLDKFEPPGIQLTPATQPRLFAVLNEVAVAMKQRMPAEVYLLCDVDAWVTHRGGVMGVGSRRVMGLGLPLLQLVSVSELKAILAHEFAHYCTGDVKLGPWIYKTRGAIARTLAGLSGTGFDSLFFGYGRLFLRVSAAVSRHQEYFADRLAAGAMGAGPLVSGLRKVSVGGHALGSYMTGEFGPVLAAGYVPSLVEGFSTYLEQPHLSDALYGRDDSLPSGSRPDQYDTHPALADRVAALNAVLVPPGTESSEDAIDLLGPVKK